MLIILTQYMIVHRQDVNDYHYFAVNKQTRAPAIANGSCIMQLILW